MEGVSPECQNSGEPGKSTFLPAVHYHSVSEGYLLDLP